MPDPQLRRRTLSAWPLANSTVHPPAPLEFFQPLRRATLTPGLLALAARHLHVRLAKLYLTVRSQMKCHSVFLGAAFCLLFVAPVLSPSADLAACGTKGVLTREITHTYPAAQPSPCPPLPPPTMPGTQGCLLEE